MSPKRRVVRTCLQVAMAVLAAVPAALAAVPSMTAEDVTRIVGLTGFLVVLISAAHNAFDATQSPKEDP
jgi:hypothetical protein